MLYLNPPYQIIDGVTLLPDHEDPEQFYYMPLVPRLVPTTGADGVVLPKLSVLRYVDLAEGGGFLQCDVDLGIAPERLDDIRQQLQSARRLRNVRLAPVPVVDGQVKLVLLDADSTQPALATGAPVRFVEAIRGAAKPALYGDNQAMFSVQLTDKGVQAVDAALRGELSPLGVIYQLDFIALRPSYQVKLKIDWDRVQKHLDESFGHESVFTSIEVGKAVDELVDERAIEFSGAKFTLEDDDPGSQAAYERAKNDVLDMITDGFFEPSLSPPTTPPPDGWDRFSDTARRLQDIGTAGPLGLIGKFKYKKTDYTRIDRKILNIDMHEATAVRRSIYPQGHLAGLYGLLGSGIDPSRLFREVRLNDPWFQTRRVRAVLRGVRPPTDNVESVQVRLRYGNEQQTLSLDAQQLEGVAEWLSIVENGEMKPEVEAAFEVRFRNVESSERPVKLSSPVQTVLGTLLEVDPRELYGALMVPITAVSFPWDQFPSVEVSLRYDDAPNGLAIRDTFLLSKETPQTTWDLTVLDRDKPGFEYFVRYFGRDNRNLESGWVRSERQQLTLTDPRGPALEIPIMCTSPALQTYEKVFVDVSYEDAEADIRREQPFEFDLARPEAKTFVVYTGERPARPLRYRVTLVAKNGNVLQLPEATTLDRRVIVTGATSAHRLVQVRATGDFEAKRVRQLVVELNYPGPSQASDRFELNGPNDLGVFEYDVPLDGAIKYRYRVRTVGKTGLWKQDEWKESSEGELRLPIG